MPFGPAPYTPPAANVSRLGWQPTPILGQAVPPGTSVPVPPGTPAPPFLMGPSTPAPRVYTGTIPNIPPSYTPGRVGSLGDAFIGPQYPTSGLPYHGPDVPGRGWPTSGLDPHGPFPNTMRGFKSPTGWGGDLGRMWSNPMQAGKAGAYGAPEGQSKAGAYGARGAAKALGGDMFAQYMIAQLPQGAQDTLRPAAHAGFLAQALGASNPASAAVGAGVAIGNSSVGRGAANRIRKALGYENPVEGGLGGIFDKLLGKDDKKKTPTDPFKVIERLAPKFGADASVVSQQYQESYDVAKAIAELNNPEAGEEAWAKEARDTTNAELPNMMQSVAAQREQATQQMAYQQMMMSALGPVMQAEVMAGKQQQAAYEMFAKDLPPELRPYAEYQAAQSVPTHTATANAYMAQAMMVQPSQQQQQYESWAKQVNQQAQSQAMSGGGGQDPFAALAAG